MIVTILNIFILKIIVYRRNLIKFKVGR